MSKLWRRALIGVALGVVGYVVAVIALGAREVADALSGYPWWIFAVALALSSVNYLLRFIKWELSLSWLDVRRDAPDLSRSRSLLIYLAGLSMSVTPGKVGEVLRSSLLKASDGVPFTRTAPVVVADRLTDLLALVVLSLVGIAQHAAYVPLLVVTVVLVLAGVLVLGSPRVMGSILHALARFAPLRRFATGAMGLIDSSATLLRLRPLAILTGLGVVGWGLECIGYWLILHAFAGVEVSLSLATFLWAAGTIVGALSFLPGGLGATEGALGVGAARLAVGVTQSIAVASTLLARVATLWYGELVGAIAVWLFLRDPAVRRRASEDP